mmetsp:Transcript_16275/g.28401  ORF Transcript_16275/g.28401 Transcript_16275/m.28401 type:complete len:140 (-) Transcript_16275:926-1345(-)
MNDGTHCEVVECLKDARSKLQVALNEQWLQEARGGSGENIRQEESHVEEHATSNSKTAQNATEDDPDDLAAAFFAQQAKKQQEENRLPVEEWARILLLTSSNREPPISTTAERSGNGLPAEELAKKLLEDYRQIVQSDV